MDLKKRKEINFLFIYFYVILLNFVLGFEMFQYIFFYLYKIVLYFFKVCFIYYLLIYKEKYLIVKLLLEFKL